MQLETQSALTGYSDQEKGAYLGALASLATADREASQEELEHIREMAQAADLSPEQEQEVLNSARETSGQELKRFLDVLRNSDLRYSLVTDLIALAKVDEDYSPEEKRNIENVAKYLQVNQQQFNALDQLVNKAAATQQSSEQISKPGFLDSLGLRDQFSQAGLNIGSGGRGILGFLGPMILGGLAARAIGGNRRSPGMGGGLGGMLGGMLDGGGGMGSGMGLPGGFGSLLNGLSNSRRTNSMGGLLGRLLR